MFTVSTTKHTHIYQNSVNAIYCHIDINLMLWLMVLLYIIPVLTLICLAFLYVSFLEEVFALSPSFSRQEIKDRPLDWRDIDRQKTTDEGSPFTDIRRVNYFSDG